jgi:hypothetical protein
MIDDDRAHAVLDEFCNPPSLVADGVDGVENRLAKRGLDIAHRAGTVGEVRHIHVAAVAGRPMQALQEASVTAGSGLLGDRYALGCGYWIDRKVSRDLTLIESEVLDDLARTSGIRLSSGDTRRNITTRHVRLNDLVGSLFWIGDVLCRGTGLCEPCRHLEQLTGQRLIRTLVHRGGLRADAVTSGVIRIGDPIELVEELPGVGAIAVRDQRVLRV